MSWWTEASVQQQPSAFYARLAQREEQDRLRRLNDEIHYPTLAQDMEKRRQRKEAQEQAK